jgi:class 3 adenylate cyclase
VDDTSASPSGLRASDAEREAAVETLKERTADGTLTLDEFAMRVERALAGRYRGDLDALLADLPARRTATAGKRSPRHHVIAIMSGANTKGRWRCGDRVTALAVMGGCHIDFRGAEITAAEVHVTAIAIMGGIHIVVPEGIEVTMDGLPIMGGRSMQVKDVPPLPGSPRIVVHALPIMGGVTVQSRPRKQARQRVEAAAASRLEAAPAEAAPLTAAAAETPLPLGGTVTIMFSDVCDYSGITERLGDDAAHALLREHNDVIRALVRAHGGHEVKSSGDGFMVAFASASGALRCAVALQQAFAERNAASPGEAIRVHIGIHAGDVVREDDDFLGSAVIVASRLADAAGPDEILVSSVARELAGGSREFTFAAARPVLLKGFHEARQAYPIEWQAQGAPVIAPPRSIGKRADEPEAV